jgi:hypothetical protein
VPVVCPFVAVFACVDFLLQELIALLQKCMGNWHESAAVQKRQSQVETGVLFTTIALMWQCSQQR